MAKKRELKRPVWPEKLRKVRDKDGRVFGAEEPPNPLGRILDAVPPVRQPGLPDAPEPQMGLDAPFGGAFLPDFGPLARNAAIGAEAGEQMAGAIAAGQRPFQEQLARGRRPMPGTPRRGPGPLPSPIERIDPSAEQHLDGTPMFGQHVTTDGRTLNVPWFPKTDAGKAMREKAMATNSRYEQQKRYDRALAGMNAAVVRGAIPHDVARAHMEALQKEIANQWGFDPAVKGWRKDNRAPVANPLGMRAPDADPLADADDLPPPRRDPQLRQAGGAGAAQQQPAGQAAGGFPGLANPQRGQAEFNPLAAMLGLQALGALQGGRGDQGWAQLRNVQGDAIRAHAEWLDAQRRAGAGTGGLIPSGAMDFSNNMQSAMDRMSDVNKSNQAASVDLTKAKLAALPQIIAARAQWAAALAPIAQQRAKNAALSPLLAALLGAGGGGFGGGMLNRKLPQGVNLNLPHLQPAVGHFGRDIAARYRR